MVDAKRRAELVEEELAKRRGSREDMRAQLEREAEAGLKLQLQQKDFEWRQKYQVMIHVLCDCPLVELSGYWKSKAFASEAINPHLQTHRNAPLTPRTLHHYSGNIQAWSNLRLRNLHATILVV